ncbi:hypothetical protein NDU88_006661 [Pleurodeles waltl]|uniref:Uncharacterized protein n=1 Tax=Pleurodeles waltl TaxID=8319 RepID=A0AAV7L7X5_PLEWA|nr:hypothetical protein NDU88_006661 [Pleurodeles waltl]
MEPSWLSAVRRGHPQRPQYGQTLVQNGALRAVSRQARAPTETPVLTDTCTEWSPLGCQARAHTETPVRTDTCTEWSPLACQPSGEGTHRDPSTDRHLYRMELSAVRTGHPQRPLYGLSALRRGHPQRPQYGQTLVQNGALRTVSRQARAPTETPVRTNTCKLWSPPGCQPSGEGTHRDRSTDRHLNRMEPSGLSAVRRGHPQRTPVRAVRRGHPQRPWYGQTLVQNGPLRAVRRGLQRPRYGQALVQNGVLWAVSRQARVPTESPVRTDTWTEWSPLGCSRQARAPTETLVRTDTCTEWSRSGCRPSGEGTHKDPSTDRHLNRMEPSGLSAVVLVLQRPRYGQTVVENGALRAVSPQPRAPTVTCYGQTLVHLYRMEPSGLSGEGHRDPGMDRHLYRMQLSAVRRGHPQRPITDRHLYRMEPSGLSAVRRGHPQRPRYGQTLVNYGALQAVSRQARAPTETAVRTDTCTEWSPPGCEPPDEGTHRYPSTDRHLYRMESSGLSAVRRGHPQRTPVRAVRRGHPQRHWYGQTLVQNGPLRAVNRQARVPTESPVRTDTWTEWSPLGCSRQARAPTETLVRTDTCTEWSRPGCRPSGEGTHRDPSTDRHLYRMEPSGQSAVRRGHPQRPRN